MPADFSGRLLIVLYAVHSSPTLLASADKQFSMADVHPSATPAILNSVHHGQSFFWKAHWENASWGQGKSSNGLEHERPEPTRLRKTKRLVSHYIFPSDLFSPLLPLASEVIQ